jgi:hypothetical protein
VCEQMYECECMCVCVSECMCASACVCVNVMQCQTCTFVYSYMVIILHRCNHTLSLTHTQVNYYGYLYCTKYAFEYLKDNSRRHGGQRGVLAAVTR